MRQSESEGGRDSGKRLCFRREVSEKVKFKNSPKTRLFKRVFAKTENVVRKHSSKMAPEAPFGQFRRFRKSMIFAFFGRLEARIRCYSAISGEAPT